MTDRQDIVQAIPVETGYHVEMPDTVDVSNKMIECYNLRRTVMILCAIDFFFDLVYSFYLPYFIIPTFIALFGYHGADKYKKCLVLTYFIYVTADWLIKLGLHIANAVESYNGMKPTPTALAWILVIITTMIDVWISKIVYKYWDSLKNMPLLELSRLKDATITIRRFVYW